MPTFWHYTQKEFGNTLPAICYFRPFHLLPLAKIFPNIRKKYMQANLLKICLKVLSNSSFGLALGLANLMADDNLDSYF